ncbi:transposase [Clostridium sp. WILCCON 0269]|uniref:Transposase n=1 Tax=Candidatus Clostridium eludens TaxID=3381663 RepID=A0ABW8SQ84_9CLOT
MNSRPEELSDMVKNNTRSTTLEERIQIIEYCIKNDKNYALTAKEFNVSYGQVYNWVRKYNANRPESLLDHRGKCKDKETMTGLELLQIENRMLKAETKKQQMEIDFLKKLEEIERRRF